VIKSLRRISGNGSEALTELDLVGKEMAQSKTLQHLWSEYSKTLHPQRQDDGMGQWQIARWRSTTLADSFFTEQAIVDSRLRTEFFRHLPGLLTGLGIIGTFAGLIGGLINFDVAVDPGKAQEQLRGLVNSVGHAFYISASAIFLAMLFTWIEKTLLTARYRQVEVLRELIDGLFKSGAGEEYLERLVVASETSATQAEHIKDALIADLKEILFTLTQEQIKANASHAGQMSSEVGRAISESLATPMAQISGVVQTMGQSQGDAVNKMLTDVLASFSSQLKDMFGTQMHGMTDLMMRASESMQATAIQFGQLAANMDSAGTNTVDMMGERLVKSLEAMDERQAAMNSRMGEFVEQIRNMVSQSQSETSQKLQESISAMSLQIQSMVEQLRRQSDDSAASQGQRVSDFERSTAAAIEAMTNQLNHLVTQSNENLRIAMSAVNSEMGSAVGMLSKQAAEAAAAQNERSTRFEAAASNAVDVMSTQVGSLVTQSNETLREAMSAVNREMDSAVGKLSKQAEEAAASQGQRVSDFERSTAAALEAMTNQLNHLVTQSNENLRIAMSAVNSEMGSAVGMLSKQAAEAAAAQNERSTRFEAAASNAVDVMSTQVGSLVTQSNETLREAMSAVNREMDSAVGKLRKQAEEAAEAQNARSSRFEAAASAAIQAMSGQVEKMVGISQETNRALQSSVAGLERASYKAITEMNSGAEKLLSASTEFAKSGQAVSETMRAATSATESIRAASGQLSNAADSVKATIAEYGKTRDVFATMIADLKETFDTAKKDAGMTTQLVQKLEAASHQLAIAQEQSETYLKGVTQVLVKAHDSFRENVERTLSEGNRKFHGELSSAVNLLSGAIKNLGDVVDDIPVRR
jgi:ABC-type transporter Mla subunit MlaD